MATRYIPSGSWSISGSPSSLGLTAEAYSFSRGLSLSQTSDVSPQPCETSKTLLSLLSFLPSLYFWNQQLLQGEKWPQGWC